MRSSRCVGDLLDAGVQRLERVLQVARVGHQVGLPVLAEHDLLRAAHPPEAEAEHQQPDQGDERRGGGGEGNDPRSLREVRHRPRG